VTGLAEGGLASIGPLAWYMFVMAATPGPNNAMLAASGMNFGLRATAPHILGVACGWLLLLALCALGLGVLFQQLPHAELALGVLGAGYLAYLAWRIANAGAPTAAAGARPMSFLEAFGFQFVNPKGWVMAIFAGTLAPSFDMAYGATVVVVLVGAFVGVPSMSAWVCFGAALARLFRNDRIRRWINWVLAALLLLTIPFMFG